MYRLYVTGLKSTFCDRMKQKCRIQTSTDGGAVGSDADVARVQKLHVDADDRRRAKYRHDDVIRGTGAHDLRRHHDVRAAHSRIQDDEQSLLTSCWSVVSV